MMRKILVALVCAQCFVFSFLASSYSTCIPYNTSQCAPFRLFILLVRVWMTEDMLVAIVSARAKLCCTVSSVARYPTRMVTVNTRLLITDSAFLSSFMAANRDFHEGIVAAFD